jgi:hypothetical protein
MDIYHDIYHDIYIINPYSKSFVTITAIYSSDFPPANHRRPAWSCSKAATQLGTRKVRFSCEKRGCIVDAHALGQATEKKMRTCLTVCI